MENNNGWGTDYQDTLTKVKDMTPEQVIGVLVTTLNEACSSMENRDGLRTGLYLRFAQKIALMSGIKPIEIDDYDIDCGGVYLAEE